MSTERSLSTAIATPGAPVDAYDRLLSTEDTLEVSSTTTNPGSAYDEVLEAN
jgi:hypothetical protein